MKKQKLLHSIALVLAMAAVSDATAQTPSRQHLKADEAKIVIDRTGAALLDQIKCQRTPQVSRTINAMLQNRLIRYVANESGVYLFKPTVPLAFLGLRVTHISGFDYDGFIDVPGSTMVGGTPPVFLEIDVAASTDELRKRALDAGLVEVDYQKGQRGFEVSAGGSYLADDKNAAISSIQCTQFVRAH